MEYRIIRSKRRTVCIQMTANGEIVVRAPKRCSRAYIDQFVNSKSQWIIAHQQKLKEQTKQREEFSFQPGDMFFLCGKSVPIRFDEHGKVKLQAHELQLPTGDMKIVRKALILQVKTVAYPWLCRRLDYWAAEMGISYNGLRLSTARCRWGSCSGDGMIRISVFLLFAPERAIDYVLVHELAHRKKFDHSPAFWHIVAQTMPDYMEQRRVLQQYQGQPFLQSLAKREE